MALGVRHGFGPLLAGLLSLGCGSDGTAANNADAGPDAPVISDAPPNGPDPQHWHSTGSLVVARMNHTATLLPSGHVLVVGGERFDRTMLASVEEYDPDTGRST